MRPEGLCVITVSPQKLNYTLAGCNSICKGFAEIFFKIILNPIGKSPIPGIADKKEKAPCGAFQVENCG